MIRGLLADRFRLVMRIKNKKMPVYALTVTIGGPKLERSTVAEKECIFDTDPEGCHNFVGHLGRHPPECKRHPTQPCFSQRWPETRKQQSAIPKPLVSCWTDRVAIQTQGLIANKVLYDPTHGCVVPTLKCLVLTPKAGPDSALDERRLSVPGFDYRRR